MAFTISELNYDSLGFPVDVVSQQSVINTALSSSSSFISDTGSIEITIKQHRGQTGNIQKYTQNDQSNAETERDKDRKKNIENYTPMS